MLPILLMLACTGTHPETPETLAEAEPPVSEIVTSVDGTVRIHSGKAPVRPVATHPSSLHQQMSSYPGKSCVTRCVEDGRSGALSEDALRMQCVRGCSGDGFLIRDSMGISSRSGARVAIEGVLLDEGGLVLLLGDGTRVLLPDPPPAEQWKELVDREVRIVGVIYDAPPSGDGKIAPQLVQWDHPVGLRLDDAARDTGDPEG